MSLEMSGAVNQLLNYRDELQKNFSTLTRDLEEADTVRAFSPEMRCCYWENQYFEC